MTKAQERAVENLKTNFFKTFSYGAPEKYEFKDVSIEEWAGNTVHVHLEIGRIGDEGTMAAVLCRNWTSVCIGARGGYFTFRKKSGKHCPLDTHKAVWNGYNTDQYYKKQIAKKEA